MKSLLVLRHGKSNWSADYATDHDRPLAPRGIEAARLIGRFVASVRQEPSRVISSSAVRARRTAELAMAAGNWRSELVLSDELYGASPATAITLLNQLSDTDRRVLLVGHQPTLADFIATLTGGLAVRFPTAALARVDLSVEAWNELGPGGGSLRWLVTPKLLLQAGCS